MAKKKTTLSNQPDESDDNLLESYDEEPYMYPTMNFLMTYGWYIVIILVAIGALLYFGVLYPDNFKPVDTSINTSANMTVEDKAQEQGCNWVIFVDDETQSSTDCFADIYYNRMRHLDKEGMYCFFNTDEDFLLRCKSGVDGN